MSIRVSRPRVEIPMSFRVLPLACVAPVIRALEREKDRILRGQEP